MFSYNPSTGVLRWKARPVWMFFSRGLQRRIGHHKTWNMRFADMPAGRPGQRGYLSVSIFSRRYKAHRIIWKMVHGTEPDFIDHINRKTGDNRIANLRSVSPQENNYNLSPVRGTASGVRGVRWHPAKRKWEVDIASDRKRRYIGAFERLDDAIRARREAEKIFHKISSSA